MKCPVCKDVTLLMTEKSGVEIDYCPECRGIWLDRGELEKLLNKEEAYNHSHYKEYKENYAYDKPKKKKKEGFMSEVFDLFGGD